MKGWNRSVTGQEGGQEDVEWEGTSAYWDPIPIPALFSIT